MYAEIKFVLPQDGTRSADSRVALTSKGTKALNKIECHYRLRMDRLILVRRSQPRARDSDRLFLSYSFSTAEI
jgi:hypothetical protein